MLSHFQKRKLTRYFNTLDRDAKGFIEEEDIYMINLRMAQKNGIEENSEGWDKIRDNVDMIWKYARRYGVSGDPDKVFLIDWLAHEESILADDWFLENYVKKITRDVFLLFMQPEDERLYLSDYRQLIGCFGVEEGVQPWAFDQLDRDGKGYLTCDEFVKCVEEFHLSRERYAPGNFLFGPF